MAVADKRKAWHAFSGGEIDEELFGRVDLQEYSMALALCKNFTVRPHGPLVSRAGTQFVETTKTNGRARLIPFIRGNSEALVIELGAGYARFHRDGGTVLTATGEKTIVSIALIAASDPPNHTFTVTSHGYSNGNQLVLYGVTRNGVPVATGDVYTVANKTTHTFQLLNSSGQRIFGSDLDATLNDTYADGFVNLSSAAIYEVTTPYSATDVFQIKYDQFEDKIRLWHSAWRTRDLSRTSDNDWDLDIVVNESAIDAPGTPSIVATGVEGAELSYRYLVTAVDFHGEESVASDTSGVTNDISIEGQFNTITWSAVSGAKYYNVYKEWAESGQYYLIASTTDYAVGVVDDNIIPDFTKAPPEATNPFGTADGTTTLPSVGTFHEQRSISAAPLGDPQRFWATKSGSDANMNVSIVPQDDDPFNFRLSSRRAHTIRHIIPFSRLLMLTGSGLWSLSPDSGGVLTPLNISSSLSAQVGSTDVRPSTFQEYLLYANARGEHIIEVEFSQEAGGFKPQDLSLVAPHLIDGMRWVQMDFQEAPYPTWWGVRSDGALIGMTYSPKQNVAAWHQHYIGGTDAFVESIAVIPENDAPGDVVYLIVRRTVNGNTVRYVEFIKPRAFVDLEHSFCADAGLMYDGVPNDDFSGLGHLEGETVAVLADGVPATAVVSSGAIHLSAEASVVVIGLPYNCDIKTLPLNYQTEAMGMEQNEVVSNVLLRVKDTVGLSAGPDFSNLQDFTLDPGESEGLRNRVISTAVKAGWDSDSQVCIRQSQPLPVTIAAMSVDFADAEGD